MNTTPKNETPCLATGLSMAVEGHTHTCVGRHDAGDHFCADCGRWWWQNPIQKGAPNLLTVRNSSRSLDT